MPRPDPVHPAADTDPVTIGGAPPHGLAPALVFAAAARCDRPEIGPILRANPVPRSVLALGPAGASMAGALRVAGIATTTLSRDSALEPDIVAPIDSIPAEPGHWDAAVCGPGFERMPFDRFGPALRELHRVVSGTLTLSLPERGVPAWLAGLVGRDHGADDEACWVIGGRSTPRHAVTAVMEITGWRIVRTWRPSPRTDIDHATDSNGDRKTEPSVRVDRSRIRRVFTLHRQSEAA